MFKCKFCDKTFVFNGPSLRKHELTHSLQTKQHKNTYFAPIHNLNSWLKGFNTTVYDKNIIRENDKDNESFAFLNSAFHGKSTTSKAKSTELSIFENNTTEFLEKYINNFSIDLININSISSTKW